MRKEMQVIPLNRVVDKKRIIRKNGEPRRRRGTRGRCSKKMLYLFESLETPFPLVALFQVKDPLEAVQGGLRVLLLQGLRVVVLKH
jgi:hypothetical protein